MGAMDMNHLFDFYAKLNRTVGRAGLIAKTLGEIEHFPLVFLKPAALLPQVPCILIAAGFHGDEPASVWGVLRFMEEHLPALCESINISFLPLVNPTGFAAGHHLNSAGQDPNRGFCHTQSGNFEVSHEGTILIRHINELRSAAKHGFISLHEDYEEVSYYLYTFEPSQCPGEMSLTLRDTLSNFFPQHPDGELEGGRVQDGIMFNKCDGSFEDYLFHEGVPCTACTETPGLVPLEARIQANAEIAKSFAKYIIGVNTRGGNEP